MRMIPPLHRLAVIEDALAPRPAHFQLQGVNKYASARVTELWRYEFKNRRVLYLAGLAVEPKYFAES
jgi:hypothetical protein